MAQIFCDPSLRREDGVLILTGENRHHLVDVLRMRPGEEVSVYYAGDGTEYRYGIASLSEGEAVCRLRFTKAADVELPCSITVLQGLPKADKMETVIQKTVELGVSRILPVACARSVVRLEGERARTRVERWRRIASSAAEQARRAVIPEVALPLSFSEALRAAAACEVRLMPWELAGDTGSTMEDTRRLLRGIRPGQGVAVLIGPEGGFAEEEVKRAVEAGFAPITLGRRILRTETAAMAVLSWLVLLLEST